MKYFIDFLSKCYHEGGSLLYLWVALIFSLDTTAESVTMGNYFLIACNILLVLVCYGLYWKADKGLSLPSFIQIKDKVTITYFNLIVIFVSLTLVLLLSESKSHFLFMALFVLLDYMVFRNEIECEKSFKLTFLR